MVDAKKILSQVQSLKAAALMLADEATRIEQGLVGHVYAGPRKGRTPVLSAKDKAALKAGMYKTAFKTKK